MSITLQGIEFRNGVPCRTTLELEKQADGKWRATKFGDAMQSAYNASRNRALQSHNYDTYEARATAQTKLTDQEIAKLAGKYDSHNMTQGQYDLFLDDLIEKDALSRFDAMRLGYHGWRVLDIDPEAFASGGAGCGSACVTSAIDSGDRLKELLEDTDGDLIAWLENMLAQQDQGPDAVSKEKKEALKTLHDIVKRMDTMRG